MIIKEYRIPVPFTTKEYQIAQLYAVAEASKKETGGGEGVEVLVNEPYEDENGKGQFTHKIYHLSHKVPAIIRVLAPNGSLQVHEKAWNAFPYCRTEMTNEFMKDKFQMTVISQHVDNDIANKENIHNLSDKELKHREIVNIDIANDPADAATPSEEDPQIFISQKTGRGPLGKEWTSSKSYPIMTCYKLVTVEFKWFGLQKTVESLIHKHILALFTRFHRQAFCWIDKWIGLTMQDIRALEQLTKEELSKKLPAN